MFFLHQTGQTLGKKKSDQFSASIYKHHHLLLSLSLTTSFMTTLIHFPASAYQWRWVWEQRQRSSGTVSGSCRPNARGCCGWSGIRGLGETWANQHTDRGRERTDLDTRSMIRPSPNEARGEERNVHNNRHHNIAIGWKRKKKEKNSKERVCFYALSLPSYSI